MMYLILSADVNSFLRNEFTSDFDIDELNLSSDLLEDIKSWHEQYFPIILMEEIERKKYSQIIDELDKKGIFLAKMIAKTLNNGTKVKYFSEGKSVYLPVM